MSNGEKFQDSKALNLALGNSFDRHVLGGYRFLMRHYRNGTKVFILGFSRGAYTARFLNEMLDYAGLLGPDNEEALPFVWDAFASFKLIRKDREVDRQKARGAFEFLKYCRATLCRPIERVHFLGMFDAVNSVAEFEVNVDRMPSSRIIRHAVSIDERRIKFRPTLLQLNKNKKRRYGHTLAHAMEKETEDSAPPATTAGEKASNGEQKGGADDDDDDWRQDAQEVWFPGGHADIGGGFKKEEGEDWSLSHAPLVWMVQEAHKAGLQTNDAVHKLLCYEDSRSTTDPSVDLATSRQSFLDALHSGSTRGTMHNHLRYGGGLPFWTTISWRLFEYLPFRRQDLQPDGRWKVVRWPPPLGSPRGIPEDAQIHVSAIQRMKADSSYRPRNLLRQFSGEGTNTMNATSESTEGGIGEWRVDQNKDDPVREVYLRKTSHNCREQGQ